MFKDPRGPIEGFDWANFTINGEEHSKNKGVGKDILVIGNEVSKWKKMGGHHLTKNPLELLEGEDIDTLIIGIGVYGAVEVNEEVREKARSLGIKKLIVEKTEKACKRYNELFGEGKKLALLAHGTC